MMSSLNIVGNFNMKIRHSSLKNCGLRRDFHKFLKRRQELRPIFIVLGLRQKFSLRRSDRKSSLRLYLTRAVQSYRQLRTAKPQFFSSDLQKSDFTFRRNHLHSFIVISGLRSFAGSLLMDRFLSELRSNLLICWITSDSFIEHIPALSYTSRKTVFMYWSIEIVALVITAKLIKKIDSVSYTPFETFVKWPASVLLYAPAPKVGGIKRWCASDVCLPVCRVHRAKSRTERPRKGKIIGIAHVTRDSDTIKRSKVNL